MGLLYRAENASVCELPKTEIHNENTQLDDMGKVLKERIGRLPEDVHTPYTALNLLKAYCSFETGVCLSLKDGIYSSYTSVGLGVEGITISEEVIKSGEKSPALFFKIESDSEGILKLHKSEEGTGYWVFHLDSEENAAPLPWKYIMILGVQEAAEANGVFNPESISAVLSGITGKFILNYHMALSEVPEIPEPDSSEYNSAEYDPGELPSDDDSSPAERIKKFQQVYSNFNCILLEKNFQATEEEKENFCNKVTDMISITGTVIAMEDGRPLVLVPKSVDRELVAHRLSASLKTRALMLFEADSPEKVFDELRSLK